MLILGFTGSRYGMTPDQEIEVKILINEFKLYSYKKGTGLFSSIDGCCRGADDKFFEICVNNFFETIGRPGPKNKFSSDFKRDYMHEPMPFLVRNKLIVDDCDLLLAVSNTFEEVQRSGTWSTIRYAKKQKQNHVIIYPDGSIKKNYYN